MSGAQRREARRLCYLFAHIAVYRHFYRHVAAAFPSSGDGLESPCPVKALILQKLSES